MRYVRFSIGILWLLAASAKADQFCFALASSYYEQVYCQLQSRAQTKQLPPFYQFKKNTEPVQYSLLKRIAERNAIKLPAPKLTGAIDSSTNSAQLSSDQLSSGQVPGDQLVNTQSDPNKPAPRIAISKLSPEGYLPRDSCVLRELELECGDRRYRLTGNKANHRLNPNALSGDNAMALPSHTEGALTQYLNRAYLQYLNKMLDIGLGGVTMSYAKFVFLYQDIHAKGLNFSQRFELMYGFLKKDKAAMAVSESVASPPGLEPSHCAALGESLYVCDLQGRNYIFVRE